MERLTNREKHPEIWAAHIKARDELRELQERSKPLKVRMQELAVEIAKLRKEQMRLGEEIQRIEQPKANELRARMSNYAKAMGGYSMSNRPGER